MEYVWGEGRSVIRKEGKQRHFWERNMSAKKKWEPPQTTCLRTSKVSLKFCTTGLFSRTFFWKYQYFLFYPNFLYIISTNMYSVLAIYKSIEEYLGHLVVSNTQAEDSQPVIQEYNSKEKLKHLVNRGLAAEKKRQSWCSHDADPPRDYPKDCHLRWPDPAGSWPTRLRCVGMGMSFTHLGATQLSVFLVEKKKYDSLKIVFQKPF